MWECTSKAGTSVSRLILVPEASASGRRARQAQTYVRMYVQYVRAKYVQVYCSQWMSPMAGVGGCQYVHPYLLVYSCWMHLANLTLSVSFVSDRLDTCKSLRRFHTALSNAVRISACSPSPAPCLCLRPRRRCLQHAHTCIVRHRAPMRPPRV